MNLVLKTPSEAPYRDGKDLSILISCDGGMSGKALDILQSLTENLKKEDGRLLYQLWDIENMSFPELRKLGAFEAAIADMVIIGIPASPALPPSVSTWMKQWLELRKGRPGALVVLLDTGVENPETAQGMLLRLKDMASSENMDFFAIDARVGKDTGAVRGVSKVARQFVLSHTIIAQNELPVEWRPETEMPDKN